MLFRYNNTNILLKRMTTNNNFKNNVGSLLGYSKPEAVHTDRFIDQFWTRKDLEFMKSTYLKQR